METDKPEMMIPIAPSPLDAYRGRGKHAKNTTQASDETIVLDVKPEVKIKKKPGRKKKEKPLIRFQIINEPVVLVFD